MLPKAKPLLAIFAIAYAAGSPALDAVRPPALDGALRGFHEDVTFLAGTGYKVAKAVASVEPQHMASLAFGGHLMQDVGRSLARAGNS